MDVIIDGVTHRIPLEVEAAGPAAIEAHLASLTSSTSSTAGATSAPAAAAAPADDTTGEV